MMRFSIIEVCHAHKDWFSISSRIYVEDPRVPPTPGGAYSGPAVKWFDLTVVDPTWAYLLLIQKSKRASAQSSFYYMDGSFVLFRQLDGQALVEKALFGGQNKTIFS